MRYLVFDLETTYGTWNGRVGSRWNSECTVCSAGFKDTDEYGDVYLVTDGIGKRPEEGLPFPSLAEVDVLVGHNIKFDLLWYWDHPELVAFLKRGGRIWDTMYAEYLLSAQYYSQNVQDQELGLSLKACAFRRKLTHNKLDMVAALWEEGVRTEDIDRKILLEYMQYDVLTTEDLYKAQLKQAETQKQMVMIQQRMEGMLATTEMEYNGLVIDKETAEKQMAALIQEIKDVRERLQQYVPELPDGITFNWNSSKQVSALLFGGLIKYKAQRPSLDEKGQRQYYQKTVKVMVLDAAGDPVIIKTGKNAGSIKMANSTMPDYDRGCKTKMTDLTFELPMQVAPKEKWKSATPGYWSTGAEVIEELGKTSDLPMLKDMLKLKGLEKDLGTYYIRENKGKLTGMLTNIQELDQRVHGHLNHAITATSRLSSSKPNLQNMPKEGKSEVKRIFVSRFLNGVVAEIDYSQLEVVTKAVMSGDKNLMDALRNRVDFHCDWLSLATGVPYEEVVHNCKVLELPEWKAKRSAIKPLTFGEAYGAGIATMAEASGLPADVVKTAVENRKLKYPALYAFDEEVAASVNASRQRTTSRTPNGYNAGIGFYRSCTDTIYSFLEQDTSGWQQDKGIMTAFSPTTIKNYPSQGLGGEIMQVMSGRAFRAIVGNDCRDNVKMFNTVHDSMYIDFETEELAKELLPKIASLLEDVSPYFNKTYRNVNWNTEFPVEAMYGKNLYEAHTTVHERDASWIPSE